MVKIYNLKTRELIECADRISYETQKHLDDFNKFIRKTNEELIIFEAEDIIYNYQKKSL